MSVKVVTLRTGAEVPEPVIRTVTITMSRLMETDPIAPYEAVMMAREPGYVPFGNTGETLKRFDFIDNFPKLHRTVRDVILAATEGDGMDLRLVSPYAAQEAGA
jgi:hypothetical protein